MNRCNPIPLILTLAALTACITSAPPAGPAPPPASATPTPIPARTQAPTSTPRRPSQATPSLSSDGAFLEKDPTSIRVMTYNVNWDSIFPQDDPQNHDFRAFNRVDSFRRILRAVRPDILCLQEINDRRRARELADFITQAATPSGDTAWQVVHTSDEVVATRFGLIEKGFELETGSVLTNLDQAAALVDLPDARYGSVDLYMICSHFKSGGGFGDITLRQRQADVIMAQVRDFETPGGNLDLPSGTPFVILGDFNAYDTDPALHIRTLTQGDISNERSYGADLEPDWDGTNLEEAMPSHNGLGITFYTWRDDAEPFNPWALDRIIFSDSVLHVQNAFVLNTMILADGALADRGLMREDVILDSESGNYDHLPVVVDFHIGAGA